MTVVWTMLGLLLIGTALVDLFHTLWHPRGFGTLARLVFRAVWWSSRRLPGRLSRTDLAGPVSVVLTTATWASLLVLGFALVYWPSMPQDFHYGSSLDPVRSSELSSAVYVSMVALATLGLGDVVPATDVLRVVVPLEALTGFALLTGAITWVLQLYPALSRRRALARTLHSHAVAGTAAHLADLDPSVVVTLLEGVRSDLATVEMDLFQYGESYYFRERQRDLALAANLPVARDLAGAARASDAPESRLAGDLLADGLERFLRLLRRDLLPGEPEDALAAFAADHAHEPR